MNLYLAVLFGYSALMIALGAIVINNSKMTIEENSALIVAEIRKKLAAAEK